jgi:hypothetical protein
MHGETHLSIEGTGTALCEAKQKKHDCEKITFRLMRLEKDSCVYFGVCVADHNVDKAPFVTGLRSKEWCLVMLTV